MSETAFKGKLTDFNPMSPQISGKSFGMEVTLPDGSKAFVLTESIYKEIDPNLKSPMHTGWLEWGNWIGRPIRGAYITWKGMKVIVKLEDPTT